MCMALFLATTRPVAPIPLNDANPQFNIQPITDRERPVLAQFSKPSVVYLGSHTGCSCGFGYCMHGDPPPEPPEVDTPEDVAELERVRASVTAFEPAWPSVSLERKPWSFSPVGRAKKSRSQRRGLMSLQSILMGTHLDWCRRGSMWCDGPDNKGLQLTKAARCAPSAFRSWGQSLRAAFAAEARC